MLDYFIPENPGMIIITALTLFLLWLTHKDDEKDSILRAKRHEEEKETLGTAVEVTLTQTQVKRLAISENLDTKVRNTWTLW